MEILRTSVSNIDLPLGRYQGSQGGAIVSITYEGVVHEITMNEGIRCANCPVVIDVKWNKDNSAKIAVVISSLQ